MCAVTGAAIGAVPDVIFDACNVSHTFTGFGAQIWEGDTRITSMFSTLHMKYARMKFGGSWTPPTGGTQAQMDAYVASQYDGDSSIRNTYNNIINPLGIKVIANQFEGPAAWLGTGNRLKSANFSDMARMWGSIAYYMQNHSMPITYIEMFKEPEGNWNIYVPGADYNTVVNLLRQELDSRGLTTVQICGPGLAYLYNAPSWVNALDSSGVASLGAWSTHAWDEGWKDTAALPSFLDGYYMTYFDPYVLAKDPSRSKPVIITEYATGVKTFNGVTFTESTVADSNQFAERSYENTLTLLNDGVNILSYWQASDHDWMSSGMYGLMRRQGLGSTLRPVYYAMSTLMPLVPAGASVLTKTWNDSQISAAGFLADDTFVAAFANSTASTVTKTIKVTGVPTFNFTTAKAFIGGAVVDKLASMHFDYASGTFDITLPRESTLTVVASIHDCNSAIQGDLNGDCKVNFADYGIVANDWLKDNRGLTTITVVNDFEGYIDTPDLVTDLVGTTANETPTLGVGNGHGGGQCLEATYNTWNSPWWSGTQLTFGGANGQDWAGMNTLTVWYKVVTAASHLQLDVYDIWGGAVASNAFLTSSGLNKTPAGDWVKWDIPLGTLTGNFTHVGRIQFVQKPNDYGSGVVLYDDITVYDKNATGCQGALAGDASQDCVVDFKDILVLSEHWLDCTMLPQTDCWQ
jgi:hypothetical protein